MCNLLHFLAIPDDLLLHQYLWKFNPRYERAIEEYKPNPVPPEIRLELAIFGAPFFAISFFWFGYGVTFSTLLNPC